MARSCLMRSGASVSGERTFADRLEFRSVLPRRPDAAIGDHVASLEQQLRVGDGTAQIPVGAHFVGWRVVVQGGIGLELRLAVAGGCDEKVDATGDVQGGEDGK